MPENTQEDHPNLLVVIGASAGGVREILKILRQLPAHFQGAIIVATHRDPQSDRNMLAELVGVNARMRVREPVQGEKIHCTTIYVGRNCDSIIVDGEEIHLDVVDWANRMSRINDLFHSATVAGKNAVGVILSGMLDDGVEGLLAIHEAGGKCIVQNPAEAEFPSMPLNALDKVPVDFVASTDEIASILMEFAASRTCQ